MKNWFLQILFPLLATLLLSAPDALSQTAGLETRGIAWTDLGKGAQVAYIQAHIFNSTQSVSMIRFPQNRVRMHIINDPGAEADSTGAMALRHGALGAVNGSYFNVRKLTPVTFVKERRRVEGRTTAHETFRTDGLLALRGRKVDIIHCDTLSYDQVAKKCPDAIAAGPVLLLGGWEARDEWPDESFFTKRHPRTIVGTTRDGWVYLVVIDGRVPGQADGATIHEAAQIARLIGLDDALNLDGGGSSTLWTRQHGVVSYPCDNHRFDHSGQRIVPNILIIR